MNFSAYKELEERVAPYQNLYARYPLTMVMLDKSLRATLLGYPSKRFFKRLFAQAPLTTRIKQFVQRLVARAGLHSGCAAVDVNRFPLVVRHLQSYCNEAGWNLKKFSSTSLFSIITNQGLILDRGLISSTAYRPLKNLLNKEGVLSVLGKPDVLAQTECLLEKEVADLADLLRALKINLILSENCQGRKALLAVAARRAGCCFGVIAHGYVQHSALLTILPLHDENFLLVWTQGQKRDLALADERFADRIHCIGFPKPAAKLTHTRSPTRKIAFICEPIHNPYSHAAELNLFLVDILKQVQSLAQQHGLQLEIKLHPKDRRNQVVLQTLASVGLSLIETLKPDAYPDYELFLGSNSSLLVETALAGIPTFQLEELRKSEFEAVQPIALSQLGDLLANRWTLSAPLESREMRYEDFKDFINRQLTAGR